MKTELTYKGYSGSAEISIEDECLHGRILFIDDLITYEAETPAELGQAFKQAVDDYVAYCAQMGKPANKPYSGSFNVRIGAERHKQLAHYASRNRMSLNEAVCRACDVLVTSAKPGQVTHNHIYLQAGHTGDGSIQIANSTPFINEDQQWTQQGAKWQQ